MLQVVLDHLVTHYSSTPHSVTYRPEVLTPVTLAQIREFLLQMVRCPAFQFLHQQTYALMRRILYVHVDMILAHHSFQNMNILTVAYLNQLFTAAFLDITLQHFIAVLRRPHQVTCNTAYRMTIVSIICHATKIIIFIET